MRAGRRRGDGRGGEPRDNPAFIFTMDAVLAIIPVFILLGSLSQLDVIEPSFVLQGKVLPQEKRAHDILETFYTGGVFEDRNITRMHRMLDAMASPWNYSYFWSFEGKKMYSMSKGNATAAQDVVVATKLTSTYVMRVLSSSTSPECPNIQMGGMEDGAIYALSWSTDNLSYYDYYFVAEVMVPSGSRSGRHSWQYVERVKTFKNPPSSCSDAFSNMGRMHNPDGDQICGTGEWYCTTAADPNTNIAPVSYLPAGTTTTAKAKFEFGYYNPVDASGLESYTNYTTYVLLDRRGMMKPIPNGTFYIIEVPKGYVPGGDDPEPEDFGPVVDVMEAKKKHTVIVTLKLWEES